MKYFIILLLSLSVQAQNYGLETGFVIAKDKDYQVGYTIEASFIIKTNQERKYLNNLLFSFHHSGYMNNAIVFNSVTNEKLTKENCNCELTNIGFENSGTYTKKKMVRAVGFSLGIEAFKRLYLFTGVTSSKHIESINSNVSNSYYTTHIDSGAKYFWKIKNSFIITSVKFNPETTTITLGYSK